MENSQSYSHNSRKGSHEHQHQQCLHLEFNPLWSHHHSSSLWWKRNLVRTHSRRNKSWHHEPRRCGSRYNLHSYSSDDQHINCIISKSYSHSQNLLWKWCTCWSGCWRCIRNYSSFQWKPSCSQRFQPSWIHHLRKITNSWIFRSTSPLFWSSW